MVTPVYPGETRKVFLLPDVTPKKSSPRSSLEHKYILWVRVVDYGGKVESTQTSK